MTHLDRLLVAHHGEAEPRRVAILRALQLGDMLCAVPALRAFRAAWPRAEIILVRLRWAARFTERFHHLIDGFREFPGYPGLPEQPVNVRLIPSFFAGMQAEGYDLAVQLHGSGTITTPLIQLLGAGVHAGFVPGAMPCPDEGAFLPYPDEGLEVRRLLRLVEFLGLPTCGEKLEFPIKS